MKCRDHQPLPLPSYVRRELYLDSTSPLHVVDNNEVKSENEKVEGHFNLMSIHSLARITLGSIPLSSSR